MCGIYLTYSDYSNLNNKFSGKCFLAKIVNFLKLNKYKQIYQLSENYKDDGYFINYYRNNKERIDIKRCIKLLKIHKSYKDKNLYILDAIWNLSIELNKRYLFVKKYLKTDTNNSIVFLKTLNSALNSINYQEIRGRDSLGVVVNVTFKNDNKTFQFIKKNIDKSNYHILKKNKSYSVFTIIFKTFNIYGSLGDNSKKIINIISKNKILNYILKNNQILKSYILAHTRWASMGNIDKKNTHPVFLEKEKDRNVFVMMNGTILNHMNYFKNDKKYSDTYAIPYLLNKKIDKKNNVKILKKLNELDGIFTVIFFFRNDPNKIFVYKKNNQGLYMGKNNNRLILASDKYGLIEETNKMTDLKKKTFIIFNFQKNKITNF
jgi:glutamine---fructose-6-phosphate transaminase (isomerizing)